MSKQIPILFSTPMVQAILEDRKIMTRRILKRQPTDDWMKNTKQFSPTGSMFDHKGKQLYWIEAGDKELICSYGKPGDILWVREEHYRFGKWVKNGTTKTGKQKWSFKVLDDQVLYFDNPPATFCKSRQQNNNDGNSEDMGMWYKRLARFMPKEACRIWLEVTEVRAERLQDISEADAKAEGAEKVWQDKNGNYWFPASESIRVVGEHGDYVTGFKSIWTMINGPESWEANPWVWVVSFKKIEKP